jgi:hypothetical protein
MELIYAILIFFGIMTGDEAGMTNVQVSSYVQQNQELINTLQCDKSTLDALASSRSIDRTED